MVLQARCRGCHGSPPSQTAPFPLISQADFLAPYRTGTVAEFAAFAIESDFMPLNGPPLDATDKAIMLGWLDAGTPLNEAICP